MACQKVFKQGRDDTESEGKYTKPQPSIFFTLEYNCSVKGAIEYFPTRKPFKLKSVTRFHDYLFNEDVYSCNACTLYKLLV